MRAGDQWRHRVLSWGRSPIRAGLLAALATLAATLATATIVRALVPSLAPLRGGEAFWLGILATPLGMAAFLTGIGLRWRDRARPPSERWPGTRVLVPLASFGVGIGWSRCLTPLTDGFLDGADATMLVSFGVGAACGSWIALHAGDQRP